MSVLPAETITANGTELVSWQHCETHTRSTFTILSLCLSTLVICVWNAVHPDVPFPDEPRWRVYLRRFCAFLVGLFLPEVLVLNAVKERIEARRLWRDYNARDGTQPRDEPSMFRPSYRTQVWQPTVGSQPWQFEWTLTHVYFTKMAGFVGRSGSGRLVSLSPYMIEILWDTDRRIRPLLAEASIKDRGKAGALAKALFCWQLAVFTATSIARYANHLPLSLLEVTTLAHSLCGIAAFWLWWDKPHSVDEVVVLPIDNDLEASLHWGRLEPATPAPIAGIDIVLGDPKGDLVKPILSALAATVLYGLPHLLALNTEFPTLAERRCWQVATAIITGTPLSLVALSRLYYRVGESFQVPLDIVRGALVIVYVVSSCFIVAESFRQLFALPSGAFVSPALLCYLPHFS